MGPAALTDSVHRGRHTLTSHRSDELSLTWELYRWAEGSEVWTWLFLTWTEPGLAMNQPQRDGLRLWVSEQKDFVVGAISFQFFRRSDSDMCSDVQFQRKRNRKFKKPLTDSQRCAVVLLAGSCCSVFFTSCVKTMVNMRRGCSELQLLKVPSI